jgi:hypothetical protein
MRVLTNTRRAARLVTLASLALALPLVVPSHAQQGGFAQVVPIEVPGFHGVEPRLALGYSSERPNGFVGVGWGLSGLSGLVRTKGGRGIPRFDSSDVFVLDGQELLPCAPGMASPSCTTGGTHTTKNESYLRIRLEADAWTVWGRDGTRSVLSALLTTERGSWRWGQSEVIDTHGNTTSYHWSCSDGDCTPDSIAFGPYSVRFYREGRPDATTFATGQGGSLGKTDRRLRSILVSRGPEAIRAYRLTYGQSPATGRSILTAIQQYGRDVVVDASGQILGGSALPARRFRYQGGTTGEVFPASSGE